MILDPVTISPDQTIRDAHELMAKYRISGIPVTKNKKLVGILTNRDLRFETRMDLKVSQVMKRDKLITAPEGTSLEKAREILHEHRIEKLPVVNKQCELKGLITIKDIEKRIKYPNACKDAHGRLRVGAAVGVGAGDGRTRRASQESRRRPHRGRYGARPFAGGAGHGQDDQETASDLELVAGNIATAEAAKDLLKAGVDAVKVGVGPGSICTTRIVSGAGMPQLTAIADCAKVLEGSGVPIMADGGHQVFRRYQQSTGGGASVGHARRITRRAQRSRLERPCFTRPEPTRCTAAWARSARWNAAAAIGTARAGVRRRSSCRKASKDACRTRDPCRRSSTSSSEGVKSGMGYCGCKTIPELQKNATFIRQTVAGLRESHVHDVIITKEAPNYRMDWE